MGNRKQKTSEVIVELVEKQEVLLFHDEFDDGYVSLDGTGVSVYKIKSKAFKI